MAYYGESSSESEEFEEIVNNVVSEGHIKGAPWYAKRSSQKDVSLEHSKVPALAKMTARAYQLEMLEASLKENVIVAMDTGSGKTQVAVLRIRAEVERMPSNQVVWFLAPKVALCDQQFAVIKSQIPLVQSKMIVGANNVNSWSPSTWSGALVNVKIVVSTPQILLDALIHGFVRISTLALIVFDEVHNCIRGDPGSRIMREFYRESKSRGDPIPHILGLTASPVAGSDISSLEHLEATLDAVCRSPTRHREELLAHTQRPSMIHVLYKPKVTFAVSDYTESMQRIHEARKQVQLDIKNDPYIKSLRVQKTERSRKLLEKAVYQQKTYIQEQMKTICKRSVNISRDLGSWAADWYLFETIRRFLAGVRRLGASSESFSDDEVVYLARVFQNAGIADPPKLDEYSILSEKVQKLIDVLLKYGNDAKGVVFVTERVTAVILAHILATHPDVSERYRVGMMVGTSFVPGIKQDFLDLVEKNYNLSLEAFRTGRLNLLVATSVLEEGIDVPACNLVICLDKPTSLRSFIQRRGRARMRESHLYLLVEESDMAPARDWESLEAEMKQRYEDDMRELQKLEDIEDSETLDYPGLRVESTGARLTINDATSHLDHFCATLSSRKFVDLRPDYIIENVIDESARPGALNLLKATVILPVSVPQHIRQVTSSRAWVSERNACKDAAFQAYKALFEEGLIGNNLLPFRDTANEREIEGHPGKMLANAQFNAWLDIAVAWNRETVQQHHQGFRLLDQNGSAMLEFELILPVPIPEMRPMVVYLDHDTQFMLHMNNDLVMVDSDDSVYSEATNAADHTFALLSLAYAHRHLDIRQEGYAIRLISRNGSLSTDQLGNAPFTSACLADGRCEYLVRDIFNSPYYYESLLPSKPPIDSVQRTYRGFEEDPDNEPYMVVKKCSRGPGLFHKPAPLQQTPSTKPYPRVLLANTVRVDNVPLLYAQLGLLVPSLIHYVQLYLIATELTNTLLRQLRLSDVSMVVDAICASGARLPTNYERVEFLGDSILKLCTTLNVTASRLHWPEGVLSLLKDRIVSNARLCRAAHESGLDQFIVTEQLTLNGKGKGREDERWRPPYISDLLDQSKQTRPKREMSTKTLADVVESVIGVSYLDGGLPKALQCMSLFIPEGQFQGLDAVQRTLYEAVKQEGSGLPPTYAPLEELIGYNFRKKALLVEAMTHPSYNVASTAASFDRLEFIGDAILDHIVVQELYAVDEPAPLENWKMHLLRTALVNSDILGFLVMEWTYKQLRFDVVEDGHNDREDGDVKGGAGLVRTEAALHIYSFMRHSSAELVLEQAATCKRHAELRESILEAMHTGTHYPWALLARLHAQKFYSDLFEALVGAIWVDSGPDFAACRDFVDRSGALPYLRRMRRDGVHALHPKEELGRLADQEKVAYVVNDVAGEDGEGREWACEVSIGGRAIVKIEGALFKEEAKTKAATEAVRILSAREA